jgi:helicase required for RNAi-mediated heterochromatin assembly 1
VLTSLRFVSVVALKTLHKNMRPGDPPILVAAHTNHALDQLLRHIKQFDQEFIRLGGFTSDFENIKPRTLHEVKQSLKKPEVPGGAKGPALSEMRRLVKSMVEILAPLTASHDDESEPIKSDFFVQYGIITEAQRESMIKGAREWQRTDQPEAVLNDIVMWAGPDLVPHDRPTVFPLHDFEVEEVDLEFEQLKELEAEAKIEDDDDIDTLKGFSVRLGEPLTGRSRRGVTEQKVKLELEQQDMWKIKQSYRGPIYLWMQQQLKTAILEAFRKKARRHTQLVQHFKIGRWEIESNFLEQAKIVGMTTTGLSKYRGLIQSVKPKIIMIEEAAETLEAYVTAACMESVEHLILVGDHQQLRGHCSTQELEGYPWFLDVSMFERLVRHQVGHTQLTSQRRMISEIRRALGPIYKELEDHPSVHQRKPVPGMGGVNSYFFVHDWPEDKDSYMSKVNYDEASMVVYFFERLLHNGFTSQQVTILTYYNGQRKLILRSLRKNPNFQGCFFKVVTVDSYQGEENDVVLLSLVRSNQYNNIGFLSSVNRLCVALSRAQRGFYIFGNAEMLCHANRKWFEVVQIMAQNPRRVGFHLPLTCEVHGNTEYVQRT